MYAIKLFRIPSLILGASILMLSAKAHAVFEFEPNQSPAQSDAFSFGASLIGDFDDAIGGGIDRLDDWWGPFTLAAGETGNFTISCNNCSFIGTMDMALAIGNSGGSFITSVDNGGDGQSETLNFNSPGGGTFYVVAFEATNTATAGVADYTISTGKTSPADVDVPTYAGTTGILTADRLGGNTSAALTWSAATDNQTSGANMKYNIYVSNAMGTVFAGSPVQTFTGVTSGTVNGLSSTEVLYVGVRAEDVAGNEETNTVTLQLDILLSVPAMTWQMYE